MIPSLFIRDIQVNLHRLEEYKTLFLEKFLSHYEISRSELKVLKLLPQDKACVIRDIAMEAHLDQGNVSRLVKNLEEKGLVVSSVAHFDRRSKPIHISPKGRDLIRKLDEALLQHLGEFIINYRADKLNILMETLADLNVYLASEKEAERINRQQRDKYKSVWPTYGEEGWCRK